MLRRDVFLVVCPILSAKVVGATFSEGFIVLCVCGLSIYLFVLGVCIIIFQACFIRTTADLA